MTCVARIIFLLDKGDPKAPYIESIQEVLSTDWLSEHYKHDFITSHLVPIITREKHFSGHVSGLDI